MLREEDEEAELEPGEHPGPCLIAGFQSPFQAMPPAETLPSGVELSLHGRTRKCERLVISTEDQPIARREGPTVQVGRWTRSRLSGASRGRAGQQILGRHHHAYHGGEGAPDSPCHCDRR